MKAASLHDETSAAFLQAHESPESDVRIWLADLDSIAPVELDELAGALDPSEHSRANQFRFAQDRHRFVARHGILRRLFGEMLSVPAAAIEFYHGPKGKPEIKSASEKGRLRFNLSHAAGFAIFALAWNRELGIDLESAARLTNPSAGLASRILSPRELAIWQKFPDAEQRNGALLRAWTRKEAFSKATGRGLSESFPQMELALDAESPEASLKIDRRWMLYDLGAPADFCAALVVEQNAPKF